MEQVAQAIDSITDNVFAFLVVVFAFRDLVFGVLNLVLRFHARLRDLAHSLLGSWMLCFYHLLLISTSDDGNFGNDDLRILPIFLISQ